MICEGNGLLKSGEEKIDVKLRVKDYHNKLFSHINVIDVAFVS
jgi:hypothetical protein